MNQKINPLLILQYEKEVASYMMNVFSKKKKNNSPQIDFELESAVDFIEMRAKFYSNIITNELLWLQEDNISYFAELDQRLKKRERIIEKIKQKMDVDKLSMREAANSICDALRFTIIIDDIFYTKKVDEYLNQIESLGYQVIRFKNVWGNEYYQGINVFFVDQDGFKFEIQFHTPNGYAIKEGKLRNVYNIIRDPESPLDLVKKSNEIRKYYQAQVRIPNGAKEYQYESNVKRRG